MTDTPCNRPRVKFLGSPSVVCEDRFCERTAAFLFRSDKGPITAYCEVHARQLAALFRVELPDPPSPCSASVALVATLTFSIASTEGTNVVWYTCHGFIALTPSIRTVAALMPVPLNANSIDFDGLFVPPANCPLGGVAPGTSWTRPS